MKRIPGFLSDRRPYIFLIIAALAILAWLMTYQLGSLVGGLSAGERAAAVMPVGWHGIYHDALYLPLKAVRSIDFYLFPNHGILLTRLPNVLFGALSVVSLTWLVWLWHGRRTALITGLLFVTSAWVLHVSRLVSFDVLYLWALPALLLMNVALQRRPASAWARGGNILLWGLLLYVPGMVWLVLINGYLNRRTIAESWRQVSRWWRSALYLLVIIAGLSLLVDNLRHPQLLKLWLGLPAQMAPALDLLKNFGNVFVHLFVRGPVNPEQWLGRAPILDIFTLAMCAVGIFFYASHPKAGRSRLLAGLFVAGAILVALDGAVSLSLLVPLLYVVAATGITYFLQEWLKVFPLNPLARGIGLGLLAMAVMLACVYNLRAYFVAWPHNETTRTVFHWRP